MSIDINKKYQTRDGRPVTELRLADRDNSLYPIAGRLDGWPIRWTAEGKFHVSAREYSHLDLVEVPESKDKERPTMTIDVTKKYQTRDGQKVTELRMQGDPICRIVGYVDGCRYTWTVRGEFFGPGEPSFMDLVEAPSPVDFTRPVAFKGSTTPLRVLCTDAPGICPVAVMDDKGLIWMYPENTKRLWNPPQTVEYTRWVNVYGNGPAGALFLSEEDAREAVALSPVLVDTIPVVIKVEK